jgi:hypothetical protein
MSSLRSYQFRIYYGPADDPLNNFYIPALSASLQYDRSAGFFSSSALAVAAAGVARLIQNGGRMRLLVGAALDEKDVESIQKGYDLKARITERLLERFPDPQDALLQRRLEVLAWMVAEGTLEIKVVLPRDERGLPIPAQSVMDYFHAKSGVFTDANGDQVAFTGSINESETAWQKNYESFLVLFSWDATRAHLAQIAINFERLWADREPNWIALDIPQAVKERLLKYRPPYAPTRDPLEHEPIEKPTKEGKQIFVTQAPQSERLLFQFLRDAPYLPNATGLGAATSAIVPWPHQSRVANAVIQRFPDRAMLCDEVGLGKTIEAGLVIRQLILSGRVKRCLILVPKSVLKQWQEELYEKFALEVPRYDAGKYLDVRDQPLPTPDGNPWDAFDVMLAGSQLAKRADRRKQILEAKPWDLLVVDEAHHARRKDFKERIYRPNRLLGLLNEINAQDKAASLLLMTATPMQIHPLEVWDLLTVLGMGGRWAADEDNFLGFFQEMRKPFAEADWELVFDLVHDQLAAGGQLDPTFKAQVSAEIGPVKWSELEALPNQSGQRARTIRHLGSAVQPHVKELARRHTPLNHYIFRNTRSLLREYIKRGILKDNVPIRRPQRTRVPMQPDEQALYDRIDEYISHFYQKYETERRGLGFVMTVYRRRLTSSFYAVRKSLERRLKFLRGLTEEVFDDDDLEQDELEQDVEELLGATPRERFKAELEYVEDFIQELRLLSISDSKLEKLKDELSRMFMQRPTALVFTQYTDTMDYLRDQLVEVYGSQVACYSGRGGQVWTGIVWAPTTKEDVKSRFGDGRVRILLCTESASEGLNLQTCGVLINYDMPWNPMRVEQRIGRIDRIGQQYREVWISNYFYQDTIEDVIYQRLADRIDWFEVVVGDLQPILAEVGEATRRLAMLPRSEREVQLEKEIDSFRQRLQNREVEALNLDNFVAAEDYVSAGPASPVSLTDMKELLIASQATGHLFEPHPDIADAYLLTWQGAKLPVTFSRECFDKHPDTVRFLSYGSPLLAELLENVPAPQSESSGSLVRCRTTGNVELRAWYVSAEGQAQPQSIETLADLRDWLARHPGSEPTSETLRDEAQMLFESKVAQVNRQQAELLQHRQLARYLAERAKAQRLLIQAALVEIALGQQPEMFESETYPSAFNEEAVLGLQRHGFPWSALLKLAYDDGLSPSEQDVYYQQIAGYKRESLKAEFAHLRDETKIAVRALNVAHAAAQEQIAGGQGVVYVEIMSGDGPK